MDPDANRFNYFGLTDEFASLERAKYVILPVPYEQTTSFGKGTALGPEAILTASREVELYDGETDSEPYMAGIHTLPALDLNSLSQDRAISSIGNAASAVVEKRKFLVTVGGEHSISAAPVRALAEKYPDLSVLQIDAHADLREEYQGSRFSHACAMRRIRDVVSTTVGVGIRSLTADEAGLIRRERIPTFFAQDIVGRNDWQSKSIEKLGENVYITIDLDGLDPSVIPGVGTPEPGGLGWYETLAYLRQVCRSRNVVGFDVVELMPIAGSLVSEFAAAKLIYKLIAYLNLPR
jgi:agmatinase